MWLVRFPLMAPDWCSRLEELETKKSGRAYGTGQERQLTYGGARPRIDPKISPNGELVAWRETYVEHPKVIITPFAGGSSRETCGDCAAPEVWTSDSRFLLYRSGQQPHTGIGIFNLASTALIYQSRTQRSWRTPLRLTGSGCCSHFPGRTRLFDLCSPIFRHTTTTAGYLD